jgi:hypothetical protein
MLSVVGKKKTDPATLKTFEELHGHDVDYAVRPDLPDGCLFFGNNKNFENATLMFRTNSFFMGSLISDPNMTYEVDPFGKHGVTFFSQLTACMSNKTPRVSAILYSHMNIINTKVYNATNPKKELTGYTKEQAATLLLY